MSYSMKLVLFNSVYNISAADSCKHQNYRKEEGAFHNVSGYVCVAIYLWLTFRYAQVKKPSVLLS